MMKVRDTDDIDVYYILKFGDLPSHTLAPALTTIEALAEACPLPRPLKPESLRRAMR